MKVRALLGILTIFALLGASVCANDDVTLDIYSFINKVWSSQDSVYAASQTDESTPEYESIVRSWQGAVDLIDKDLNILVEELLADPAKLRAFGELYGEMPIEQKEAIAPLVENLINRGTDPENFPGYGYPEPGYNYRKGQELSRETLSTFWVKEKKTVDEAQTIKTTMDLSIAAGWGQDQTASGNIEGFQIGQTSKINVNGSMKTVCEVTFTTRTTLITECTVKYQKSKTWFELWRIKKGFLGIGTSGNWMLCGKTYEITQEATGEEVIENPPTIKPTGGSTPYTTTTTPTPPVANDPVAPGSTNNPSTGSNSGITFPTTFPTPTQGPGGTTIPTTPSVNPGGNTTPDLPNF